MAVKASQQTGGTAEWTCGVKSQDAQDFTLRGDQSLLTASWNLCLSFVVHVRSDESVGRMNSPAAQENHSDCADDQSTHPAAIVWNRHEIVVRSQGDSVPKAGEVTTSA